MMLEGFELVLKVHHSRDQNMWGFAGRVRGVKCYSNHQGKPLEFFKQGAL